MERKKLTPHYSDATEIRASFVVEFQAFLTGSTEQMEAVTDAFDRHVRDFYKQCERVGVSVVKAAGQVRPMTREEALIIVPRKWHMEKNGRHICPTAHVSPKRLTKDPKKVTCKLCKKEMEHGAGDSAVD